MHRLVTAFLTAFAFALVMPMAGPVRAVADEPMEWESYRRVIEPERIPVDEGLRLKDNFESSRHCGLIQSQASLNRLWSAVISSKTPYTSRLGIGLPDAPEVDFAKYSVLWFADRDKKPGVVDSITVAAYDNDKSLFVTIVVAHQESGSQGINLWKIPKTEYSPEFSVMHK